jgi:hypothetical protein
MYKTISRDLIAKIDPNSKLLNAVKDDDEELPIKQWVGKYQNTVSIYHIIWLLIKNEFLPTEQLRLFTVWLAREMLSLIKNPDIRSFTACDVAEKFANNKATIEELKIAHENAIIARDAIYNGEITAYDIAYDINYDAADVAVLTTVIDIAPYAVAYAITNAVSYGITWDAQLNQLLTYFNS